MKIYFRILLTILIALSAPLTMHGQSGEAEETKGYIIGDFNDWNIPEEDNLKGAIKLRLIEKDYSDGEYILEPALYASAFIPENCKFVFYIPDGDLKGFYHDGTFSGSYYYTDKVCPINFGIGYENRFAPLEQSSYRKVIKKESVQKELAFETVGWNGGKLCFELPLGKFMIKKGLLVYTYNPWIFEQWNRLNILRHYNGGALSHSYIYPEENGGGDYSIEYTLFKSGDYNIKIYNIQTVSVLYSTSDSPDPDPETTFGAVYPDTIAVDVNKTFKIPVKRGGYPIVFKINSGEVIEYNLNLRTWMIEGRVR